MKKVNLKLSGKNPVFKDKLNKKTTGGITFGMISFNNLVEILSLPQLTLLLSNESVSNIVSGVTFAKMKFCSIGFIYL